MSLSTLYARAQIGLDAPLVTIETHLSNGMPGFTIVGLPETAVKESKDRVRSAILNSHFEFPQKRITINLAPADLPKEGGRYDLAIALGILVASQQIPADGIEHYEFIGELALSGALRPVRGCLPAAIACREAERSLVLPAENGAEAALVDHSRVFVAQDLLRVSAHLHQREELPLAHPLQSTASKINTLDLADVKGQAYARRALEVAASGSHNLLLFGPPGTGKSMLAGRLPGILPPLTEAEALEVAAIRSVASGFDASPLHNRPFRSPHHTSSAIALVGGGPHPRPGEVTLAHNGVLFLDELPEYPRHVLEVMREPLESGHICIARAKTRVTFPAQFQLIAAMNPCPCGYWGNPARCRCTPALVERYRRKISGPLLDRIDLQVPVNTLEVDELQSTIRGEASQPVRVRVARARAIQLTRQGKTNALLQGRELQQHCPLSAEPRRILATAVNRLGFSARAYDRVLKVARTLADMAASPDILAAHLSEALAYRALDREQ